MPEISVMVEAGKATPAAPLGPALGPLGVNIVLVVQQINEKTKAFLGMKVPVKVKVDSSKNIEIEVGTPPVSSIIKKELNLQKGASNPKTEKVGELSFEQLKKIAEMKMDSMNSTALEKSMREVIGACDSMGVQIEGKRAKQIQQEIDTGKHPNWFKTKTQKHIKKR